MGISIDGSFSFNEGSLDLDSLVEKVNTNPILNDSFVGKLIDINCNCINSFTDESFYSELQDEFFDLIQSCIIGEGEVVVDIEFIDGNAHNIYTITKDKIIDENSIKD